MKLQAGGAEGVVGVEGLVGERGWGVGGVLEGLASAGHQ